MQRGVGLPSGAIEREDEQRTRSLVQRMRLDHRLELGDETCVLAELEVGRDPTLLRDTAQVFRAISACAKES